ncbi:hypothetical protein V8E51_012962 [Hyaloscypha variabilis]
MIQQLGKNGCLIQPLINFCSAYDAYGQGVKKTDPLRLSRFDILQDAMDAFWSKVRNIQIRSMKLDHVAKEDMDAALEHMSARTHPDILQAFRSERQKIIDDLENYLTAAVEQLSIKGDKEVPPKPIKQQSYAILNGMFSSSPDSTNKMANWDAFVTAMADAGYEQWISSGVRARRLETRLVWQDRIS